jgi:cytochrome c
MIKFWKPAAFAASLALGLTLAACGGNKTESANAPLTPGGVPSGTHKTVALADLPAPYNAADLANGELIFVKCRNCHSTDPADGNKTGPNLHNVFDRHPGTQMNFKYSNAMAHNPHDKWTPEELDKWLSKPKDYLPGTKMFFNGIDNPTDRRDVIAYLLIATEK